MTENMQVTCLVSRYWYPSDIDLEDALLNGLLIDISTQTAENGKLIPVGIVMLDDDDTFQCVPMEFIQKYKAPQTA